MAHEVIVSSTTDSQEDINIAAGLPADGAKQKEEKVETSTKEQKPEAKPKEDVPVVKAKEEVKPGESEEDEIETPPEPQRKSNVQKRIDKLTAKNKNLESENERLRKLAETKAEGEGTKNAVKPDLNKKDDLGPKPLLKDFDGDQEKWVEALTDWSSKKAAKDYADKTATSAAQTAERERLAEVFDGYNKSLEKAREDFDDFDEVVGNSDLKIPESVQLAMIEMDNGAEVAYKLAQNKELCDELAKLGNTQRSVVRLGRWVEQNYPSAKPAKDEGGAAPAAGGEKPVTKERPAPVVSKASEPIKPLSGAGTKSDVPMDELPYNEFRKVRDQQEQANKRR